MFHLPGMRPSKSTAPRRAAPSKRAAFSEDAFESRKLLEPEVPQLLPEGQTVCRRDRGRAQRGGRRPCLGVLTEECSS